ncbi:hypothetical protein AB0D08_07950 [Kitasatospora sp. NPDC048540]|uniref:hypothetical protein n=1 Tax=Kitasatospora sp. NPDC048540 TaxID=3155634 RepID=UPI0033D2D74C
MLIPGEVDGLPEPDEGPQALPGFWASYLPRYALRPATAGGGALPADARGGGGADAGPEAFGVTPAQAAEAGAALAAAAGRPVARLPLEHDHTVLAVPGRAGLDLLLVHPGWAGPRLLARTGAEPAGPGLSWPELLHAARHPGGQGGVTARHPRLLLLLPALRAAALPSDAAVTVAAALAAVGTPRGLRPALAGRLTVPGSAVPGAPCADGRGIGTHRGRLLARALGAAA